MEFVQTVPKVDTVVQGILQTSFHSMMLATVTMDTVEEILSNVLEDANQLQMTYRMLLTNESETSVWLGRVLDSVMEVVMKLMSPGNVKCEERLAPLEWLLSSNSIKNEVWRAMICPSNHSLQQALLLDWMPLIQKAQGLYSTLTGKPYFNIPLSMILSEWHELYENSMKLSERLSSVSQELGEEYWKNWMPDNNTELNTGTLQKSLVWFLISLGERIEKSDLWPTVKDYFYMAYWILNYSPDVTTQPANCSFT
ncbi:uncharacterized protein LOC115800150 [Archocentrus centrarchus]|uniref:uncharacterized protein LOC115800150 n=1 Tax=Archocentrus centrarchus TaxID=63155 RepID=UPI0011E9EB03|nr:uncharacterized protein LOC115800150 [Archocentrus centrarchus]